jgi:5'-3' exonuclease
MKVLKKPYLEEKDTVVCDFSWMLYRNKYAMLNLSVTLADGTVVPTGHLHGTLMQVAQLAAIFPRVVLAVDSPCPDRFRIYPEYKGNRNKDPDEFPIKTHTNLILAAASALPNVWFMKRNGYEADDLINHVIAVGHNPVIFGTDNDLLQNEEPFRMAKNITNGVLEYIDVPTYVRDKYKVPLHFLPIWYKTIRGDSSDNLPPALPHFNGKKLAQLCVDLKSTRSFDSLIHYLSADPKKPLADDRKEALLRNYQIVRPKPVFTEDSPVDVYKLTGYPVGERLLAFQMFSVVEFYSTYFGVRFI